MTLGSVGAGPPGPVNLIGALNRELIGQTEEQAPYLPGDTDSAQGLSQKEVFQLLRDAPEAGLADWFSPLSPNGSTMFSNLANLDNRSQSEQEALPPEFQGMMTQDFSIETPDLNRLSSDPEYQALLLEADAGRLDETEQLEGLNQILERLGPDEDERLPSDLDVEPQDPFPFLTEPPLEI